MDKVELRTCPKNLVLKKSSVEHSTFAGCNKRVSNPLHSELSSELKSQDFRSETYRISPAEQESIQK
jgi:hypothetical protein